MDGELPAGPGAASGLPAGGAGGDSPPALLPAEALDLDGEDGDLEVFSKVSAAPGPPAPRARSGLGGRVPAAPSAARAGTAAGQGRGSPEFAKL